MDKSEKAQQDTFSEWELETAHSIMGARDPQVAFNVLERALATTTKDVRIEIFGEDDPDKAPRVIEGDYDRSRITPHCPAILKKEDETQVIKMLERGMTTDEVNDIALELNEQVFGEDIPRSIETKLSSTFFSIISSILYKYLGDKAIDILMVLKANVAIDHVPELKEAKNTTPISLGTSNIDEKREAWEKICNIESVKPLKRREEKLFLSWFLGDDLYDQIKKGAGGRIENMLSKLCELIETKAHFRRKVTRSLCHTPAMADAHLVSASVNQGLKTLQGINTMTEYDRNLGHWAEYQNLEENAIHREILYKADPKFEEAQKAKGDFLRKFFEENQPPIPVKLSEAIDCKRYKAELEALNTDKTHDAYNAKQKEIACRVFAAVQQYTAEGVYTLQKSPPYEAGFPMHMIEHKNATCFGGPWIMTAMLLECGIKHDDLLYAHVHECHKKDGENMIGGHGMLLLKTRMHDLIMIDHGFDIAARDFPFKMCESKKMLNRFKDLLNNKTRTPVPVRFKEQVSEKLDVHPDMQIMPLHSGFASGHLLHVGIGFFHEDKLEEARYALEMGLKHSPKDPDILYYLGLIEFKKDDYDEAEAYFKESLQVYDSHLFSLFSMGEVAVLKENYEEAKTFFEQVANEKRTIYDGSPVYRENGTLQEMAKKYVDEIEGLIAENH